MSLTTSSAAQAATTTNVIPNLKGGANPATPMLAGIVCGSAVAFAWIVCFFYWWWNHRREEADRRLTMYKLGEEDGVPPPKIQMTAPVPNRNRASSQVRSTRHASVSEARRPSVVMREKPNGVGANGATI